MEKDRHIDTLFQKYLANLHSEEELDKLLAYFDLDDSGRPLLEKLIRQEIQHEHSRYSADEEKEIVRMGEAVRMRLRQRLKGRARMPWRKYAAAAAVLLSLSLGIVWYYLGQGSDNQDMLTSQYGGDVLPIGNKAMLTLADGSVLALSEDRQGVVIGDSLRYDDGSLITPLLQPAHGDMVLTLSTPRGGTYRITLPDGTQVWLNAASILKYPNRFTGPTRAVEISGEGYFSVAEDKSRPFKVTSRGQEIEVVGTQFNVSSYTDEPEAETTLISGSVQVTPTVDGPENGKTAKLTPGNQSVVTSSGMSIREVDVSHYTAWRDGYISFNEETLEQIMRKIARSYDVEVIYQGVDKGQRFGGAVSRYENVSAVLRRLELTGKVSFTIEERRITVSP